MPFPINARIGERVLQIFAVLGAVLVVALCVALWVANQQLARMQQTLGPQIKRELRQLLGRDVRLGAVSLRGWNRIVIDDAAIADGSTFAGGAVLKTSTATARVNLLQLFFQRGKNPVAAIDRITIAQPQVKIARTAGGQWDFQDIIDRLARQRRSGALHARIDIHDGQFALRDAHGFGNTVPIDKDLTGVTAQIHVLGESYTFIASAKDAGNELGTLQVAGNYSARTGATRLDANVNPIAVKELTRFLPRNLPITFANGTAALRMVALIRTLPDPKHTGPLPATALTAEMDIAGVGLRLHDMAAPLTATSGRLRLVHDPQKFPRQSRLEFIDVRAQAGTVPLTFSGNINDLNLFDLAHSQPAYDLTLKTATNDGTRITRLFPDSNWLRELQLAGPVKLDAHVNGRGQGITIGGTLTNASLKSGTVSGSDITSDFQVRLAAKPAGKLPTVQVTSRLRRAVVSSTAMDDLRLSLTSFTPWDRLGAAPDVSGTATAAVLHLPKMTVKDVHGTVQANRAAVKIHDLRASVFGGGVLGTLTIPFADSTQTDRWQLNANYHDLDLRKLAYLTGKETVTGMVDGNVDLRATDNGHLLANAEVNGKQLAVRGYQARAISAKVTMDAGDGTVAINLPSGTASTQYGDYTLADGRYTWRDGKGELILPIHGDDVALHRFGYAQLTGMADIDGMVSGDISHPLLTAHVTAANGSLLGRTFAKGEGDVLLSKAGLRLHRLIFSRAGMTLAVTDTPDGFNPRHGIKGQTATMTLHGATVDEALALFEQQCPWRITGGTQDTVDISAPDGHIVLAGMVTIPNAVVAIPREHGTYPLRLDRLGLQFSYAKRHMTIDDLALTRKDTTIHARGTAGSEEGKPVQAELAFTGAGAQLEDLPLDLFGIPVALSGPATLNGTLSGVLDGSGAEPLQVNTTLDAPQFRMEGLPFGAGAVELSYQYRPDDHQLTIHRGSITGSAFRASATGRVLLSRQKFDGVSLTIDALDLAQLQALARQAGDKPVAFLQSLPRNLAGHGQMQVTANGTFDDPALAVAFDLSHVALHAVPLPDVRGKLVTETVDGHLRLRVDEIVAAGGKAQMHGIIDPLEGLDLQLSAQDITAQVLAPWVGALPVDGTMALNGTIHGALLQPELEAKLRIDEPRIGMQVLHRFDGKLTLADRRIVLRDGQLLLTADGTPVTISAEAPLRWSGGRPRIPSDEPIALDVNLPKQQLTALRGLLPVMPVTGEVEGALHVDGTLAQPRLSRGWVALAGTAAFNPGIDALPNRLNDLHLRADITGDRTQSTLTLTRFDARFDREQNGQRVKGYVPGWLATTGTVAIPLDNINTPERWKWDLYATLNHLSLPSSLLVAPSTSGFLRMHSTANGPLLQGVLLVEHVKLKEPKLADGAVVLGPFVFNPRLSVMLHIGEGVKMSKGMFSVPLQTTPLPRPPVADDNSVPAVQPSLPIFALDADALNPGMPNEQPGTWGAITGRLDDPRLYARFEVDKKKLSFPLNLFGSVRNARGRITYSKADGPQIVMGIPAAPTPQTAGAVSPAQSLR